MNFTKRQLIKSLNVFKTIFNLDENTRKWNGQKNKYKGKRAFLIGNGPSLNETPLYLLKNEFTLCFNRFYLLHERLNWYPYFYMCIDPEVLPNIADEINENLPNYKMASFHAVHSSMINKADNVFKMHHIIKVPYFSKRLPFFGSGGSVAYAGLQMLYYMGFSEIYLIGVDQNYVIHKTAKTTKGIKIESQHDDDPNHFDPRYFGKGKRYHQPVLRTQLRMIRAFQRAQQIATQLNIKVKNAGVGGNLEVFERTDFADLFNYSKKEIYKLFSESISYDCSADKVMSLINNSDALSEIDENISKDFFVSTQEAGKANIQKLILKYIPYGPVENKYLFVLREKKFDVIKSFFTI